MITKGDNVKMVDCAEADFHKYKVWTVRSIGKVGKEDCAWLEGYSGGFLIDCLEKINENGESK